MMDKNPTISINDKLPRESQVVRCKVNFWRYGAIHHVEVLEAKYICINDASGRPMFDIETNDMAYPEVTHWEPIK